MDDHLVALAAETGELVWETQILDYTVNPANQTSGPIVANGKVYSGRSCDPRGGPHGCVITAHDAATGEQLWRRRLIPGPGEPGDETWGDVPFEERGHVGSWMVPSVDPELNLVPSVRAAPGRHVNAMTTERCALGTAATRAVSRARCCRPGTTTRIASCKRQASS